jgi:hypothetical protein
MTISKASYPPGMQAQAPGYSAFIEQCQDPEVRWARTRVDYQGIVTGLPLNFLRSEGVEYVWADGDLRWLSTEMEVPVNLSRSENRGYNYGAFPIIHKGAFHLIGGYGFWRNHADWITFMPALGEWEINRVGGEVPEDQAVHACWKTGDTLHWLGLDALSEGELRTTQWRVLDLASKQWSVRGILDFPEGQGWRTVFELEHFIVLLDGSNGFALLRKSDGHVAIESANQWAVELWEVLHKPGVFSNAGDVLQWTTPEGELWTWNFGEHADSEVFLDYFIPSASEEPKSQYPEWLVFPLIAAAGGGMAILWLRRKPRRIEPEVERAVLASRESPVEHWSPALRALLQHPNRELVTSELDELLGISDASSPETLRARRARTIQAVNAEFELLFGYTLIQRDREQVDRRKVIYRLAAAPSMVRKMLKDWNAAEVTGSPREAQSVSDR